jgi:hypothetical protein
MIPILLAVLSGGLALAVLAGLSVAWLRARRAAGWPTAAGEIVESARDRRERTGGRPGAVYRIRLRYAYEVDGELYTGRAIAPLQQDLERGVDARDAQAILAAYPQGARVAVHYDPAAPSTAYLETGLGDRRGVVLGVAAVLLFGGLCALLLAKAV